MDDPFDLRRFVEAQEDVYEEARAELRARRKRSHWMWFIFPQIRGLGSSAMAEHYAIRSLEEARAYLRHAVLGPRLAECCRVVNGVEGRTAEEIFGYPDYLKFRSSVTLFERAARGAEKEPFTAALAKYFGGAPDEGTLARLPAAR